MKHFPVLLLQFLFWGQIFTAGAGSKKQKDITLSKFIDMIERDEQKVHDGIKSGQYENEDIKAAKTHENDDDDYGKLLFDDMANFRKVKIPGVDYNMEPEAVPVAYSSDPSDEEDDEDEHDLPPPDHPLPQHEENFQKENEELNERPHGPPAPYNYPESPPEQANYPQQPPPDVTPPENYPPESNQYQESPPPDQQNPHFDNQRLSPEHQPPPDDYPREQEPPYDRQLHRHEHQRDSPPEQQQHDQYAYQDSPPDPRANPYDYPPPPPAEAEPPNHQSIPPEAYAQLPPIEEKPNALNNHEIQPPMQHTYQEALPRNNNYPELSAIGLIQNDQPIESPINSYRETMQYNENLDPNQKALAEQLQLNPLLAVAAGPPYESVANSQIGSTYNGDENQKLPHGSHPEVYNNYDNIDNNDQIGPKVFNDSPIIDPQLMANNNDQSLTNSLSAQPQYYDNEAQQIAYANQNIGPIMQPMIPIEVETMQYDSQTPASKTVKNFSPEVNNQVSSEHKPRHVQIPDENKQITKRVGLPSQPQHTDYDHKPYPKSYKSPNRYNKPTIGSREYSKTQKYTSYTPMEETEPEPEKRDPMQQEQQSYYDRWAEEQKKYAENDKYKSLEDDVEQEMPPNYKTGPMNPSEQQYYDEQQHQNPHNHPQQPQNYPQEQYNYPQDQHNHPPEPYIHPQEQHNNPQEQHIHPQEPYNPPEDPHNLPQDHPHYDDEPPQQHNHDEPPLHSHDQRDRQSDPDRQQYAPNQHSNDHSHQDYNHDPRHLHIEEPHYNPEPSQQKPPHNEPPIDYKEQSKQETEVYDKSYESNARDMNRNKNKQKKQHSQPFQYNQQQEHPIPKPQHKPRVEPNRNYHKLHPQHQQQQGLAYQEPNSYDPFQEEYIKQQNSDPFNEKYRNDQQSELFKEHYKKHNHNQQQQQDPHIAQHQTDDIQQHTDSPLPDPYQYPQPQQKTEEFQEQPEIEPYHAVDEQHQQKQQQTDDYQQQPQLDTYQKKQPKKPYRQENYYEQQTDHYTPKQREEKYPQNQQNPTETYQKKKDHYRDEQHTTEPYQQEYQTDNYQPQQQTNRYDRDHQTDHQTDNYHQPKHQPIDPYQPKQHQRNTETAYNNPTPALPKAQYDYSPYNDMPVNDDNSEYNKDDKLDNTREGYDMAVENKQAANGQFDALTPNITGLVEPPLTHDDYTNSNSKDYNVNNDEVTSHHTPYYYENTPVKGNDDSSVPLTQPLSHSQPDKLYQKPSKPMQSKPKHPKERFQHYSQSHINHDNNDQTGRDVSEKQREYYPRNKNVVTRPTLTTESYDEQQQEHHNQHNHHHDNDHQLQQEPPIAEPAYDERQHIRGDNRYRSNKNSYNNHKPNINHNHNHNSNQQQQHNYRHYPQHSSDGSQEHYYDDYATAAADGSRVNNMANNGPHFVGHESKKVSIHSNLTNIAPVIVPQLINYNNGYNSMSDNNDNFSANNTENFFHKRIGFMPAIGRQIINNITTTTAKNNFLNRIERLRDLNRKRFLLSKKYNNRVNNLNNDDTNKQL